jgi:peptidoglycan/LPS O-acetylase OafA/YrhL
MSNLDKRASGSMAASISDEPLPLPQYIPALDGLRAIAILMVIAAHFVISGQSSIRWQPYIFSAGKTGVDLFFVLSGFLITRILLAARGQPNFLKNFYARRVLRIFPAYYGFIVFLYLLVPFFHIGQAPPFRIQIWTWTYLQNIPQTFFPFQASNIWQSTSHFWSLAVEEHFYLVWPFLVRFVHPRRLPLILLATVPFSILARCLVMAGGYNAYYFTPCRVDALGLGSLLALLVQNKALFAKASRWAMRALLLAGPVCVVGLYLLSGSRLPVIQVFRYTFAALIYVLVLLSVLKAGQGNFLHSVLTHPVMTMIGKYSYGMYLYHVTILSLLVPYLKKTSAPLAFAVILAAVFIVAALSWNLFEQRFLKMKRHFVTEAASPTRAVVVKGAAF